MSGSLLKQALAAIETLQARLEAAERAPREPIAIIGAACRYPGNAETPEDLWRIARDGVNAIGPMPPGRGGIADPQYRGGFLPALDQFDPLFFGISPREAHAIDPQHRLLLETGYEALERAGLAVDTLAGSATGVFVGITVTDYGELQIADAADAPYLVNGSATSAAAGRLSFAFGFEGPAIAIDTACSSSLVAVHLAVQSLRARETSLALAGGVNVILRPILTRLLCSMGLMAPDAACKPFDASADGFVRSEGCGMIALKRLSDAQAAGDPIVAVIRGTAVNADGRSSGLTVPRGPAQEAVIRAALANAGLRAEDIDYVEAHGTGTALGDPIEMEALASVLARGRPAGRPLLVSALKSNIGHAESAAGIAGLLKAAMALHHEQIPPTLHFNTPSPKIPWAEMAVRVPTEPQAWPRGERPRRAGISGFGVSGTNAHVIIEEAPVQDPLPAVGALPLLIPFSARDEHALRDLAQRHADHLAKAPAISLPDYVATMGQGRSPMRHRLGVIAGSPGELAESLRGFANGRPAEGIVHGQARAGRQKLAFLFTGQGAQYAGMGQGLYRTEAAFRDAIDRCARRLEGRLDRPLAEVMFAAGEASGAALLRETRIAQPALFALEYALAELWRAWGVVPQIVVGHSLGEYVAACVAGVFSLEDGLDLVAERGRLMQDLSPGAMAAVFAPEAAVAARIGGGVSVAAVNGPRETVISGASGAVRAVLDSLAKDGFASVPLDVSHAFHSPLLDPMLVRLEVQCAQTPAAAPRLLLVSNLTGQPHPPGAVPDGRYWRRHARETVRFADCIKTVQAAGATALLEVGPHPTLLGLVKRAAPDADWTAVASLRRGQDDRLHMLSALQALYADGVNPAWNAGGRRRALPTYPFQRTRYWMRQLRPETDGQGKLSLKTSPQGAAVALLSDVAMRQLPAPAVAAEAAEDSMTARRLAVRWQGAETASPRLADARYLLLGNAATRDFIRNLAMGLAADGGACSLLEDAPGGGPNAAELIAGLDGAPGTVVDCRALAPSGKDAGAASRACYTAGLALAQAVAEAGPRLGLCMLSQGALAVEPGEPIDLARTVMPGLIRTAAAEHPHQPFLMGDLAPGQTPEPGQAVRLIQALGLTQPEAAFRGGRVVAPFLMALPTTACTGQDRLPVRADGTYIVSGGLGGIGLCLAEFLAGRGAGAVLLLGRTPAGEHQRAALGALRAGGARIEAVTCDVGDAGALRALRHGPLSHCPPVRGVLHAAGVLADAPLARQDAARFESVAHAKLDGARNLHAFTAGDPLDMFVLFSSLSAVFGAPGQANYAAANAFLDGLAAWRRAQGLHGLSVRWGPWADAGMAANLPPAQQDRMRRLGIGLLDPKAALRAMLAVPEGDSLAAIASLDFDRLIAQSRVGLAACLAGLRTGAAPPPPEALAPLPPEVLASPPVMAPDEWLIAEIARVLGFERSALDIDAPLPDLGFDSMMAIHLRNSAASRLGLDIKLRVLLQGTTVKELADLVTRDLPAGDRPAGQADTTLHADERLFEEGMI